MNIWNNSSKIFYINKNKNSQKVDCCSLLVFSKGWVSSSFVFFSIYISIRSQTEIKIESNISMVKWQNTIVTAIRPISPIKKSSEKKI